LDPETRRTVVDSNKKKDDYEYGLEQSAVKKSRAQTIRALALITLQCAQSACPGVAVFLHRVEQRPALGYC
jgi:hypothetical protein